jgi:hypothetical protein
MMMPIAAERRRNKWLLGKLKRPLKQPSQSPQPLQEAHPLSLKKLLP